jgi:hypothetical protein
MNNLCKKCGKCKIYFYRNSLSKKGSFRVIKGKKGVFHSYEHEEINKVPYLFDLEYDFSKKYFFENGVKKYNFDETVEHVIIAIERLLEINCDFKFERKIL